MIPEQTVDTTDLARFLLLSPHRVRQLAALNVLERATDSRGKPLRGRFSLLGAVNSYIRYLRSNLVGGAGGTETDYTIARAERMAALAAIEQLKLRRVRGELHHGRDVEYMLTNMITRLKSRLLVIPSRTAPCLQGKINVTEIAEVIRIEIYSALQELSEYDPGKFEAANAAYLEGLGVGKPPDGNGQEP